MKLLKGIQRNISLMDYTTFKIGGRAKYFFVAKTKDEIIEALNFAKQNRLKFFILAGGSNTLFSDKGFNGLVIKIANDEIEADGEKITLGAGVPLFKLLETSKKNSLKGFEWSAGIPGTAGGAIYGNAQAFGERMADSIVEVEAFDFKSSKIKRLSKIQCKFGIKNSIFKKNKNLIILSAVLELQKGDKESITEKIKEHLKHRNKNHPLKLPSAGSVFVNPEIVVRNKKLLEEFPELKEFAKKGYVHSGYLIEKCGLRGKKCGKAIISEIHGNFILNTGGAKTKDILDLIKIAKSSVKKKFKINLVEEIQVIK